MGKGYTEEYKKEALKLIEEKGKREAVKRLGITEVTAGRWMREAGQGKKKEEKEKNTKMAGELREAQEKIRELERENARIKKENEFLEDAARFFAGSRQK